MQVPLVFLQPRRPVEVGLLWVEMLRFYSLEFNMADNVISVRTSPVLSREIKDWPKKRIAVEGQKLHDVSVLRVFLGFVLFFFCALGRTVAFVRGNVAILLLLIT